MNNPPSLTSASLLAQLRNGSSNEAAWQAFVDRYAPRVLSWCRQRNLQQADAEDVTQTILLKLARVMAEFEYDPAMSFRSWLKTVTHRTVVDFLRQQERRELAAGGSEASQRINCAAARDDLLGRLRESFDMEILEAAMNNVRGRITLQRWEAYQLTALDGLSAVVVAERLDMKIATVYTAKHKIQNMLKEEIQSMEESPASDVLNAACDS